jgi:hypothetical protein
MRKMACNYLCHQYLNVVRAFYINLYGNFMLSLWSLDMKIFSNKSFLLLVEIFSSEFYSENFQFRKHQLHRV